MYALLVIAFIFIILPTYIVLYRRRYAASKDKQLFLRENLYRSKLWVFLLILIPFVLVNIFIGNSGLIRKQQDPVLNSLKNWNNRPEELKYDLRANYHWLDGFYEKAAYRLNNSQNQEDGDSSFPADSLYLITEPVLVKSYREAITEGYRDFGHIMLAAYYTKNFDQDSVSYHLNAVSDTTQLFYNFLKGKSLSADEAADDQVIPYYIAEVRSGGDIEGALIRLEPLTRHTTDIDLVLELIALEDFARYLETSNLRKVLINNNRFSDYFIVLIKEFRTHDNTVAIIAAFLIMLVWSIYLLKISFFDKPDYLLLSFALLSEMVFCFLTFFITEFLEYRLGFWADRVSGFLELLSFSIFRVGAIEEFVKIIPLLLILLVSKKKLQPFDIILIASISAQGFAFIENIMYFDRYETGGIIHGRALTAAVGHMMFSSIFAYGFVLAGRRYKKLNRLVAFFIFWLLSAIAHGLYDFWLFAELYFFFLLFFILIARVWITILNNSLNNSRNFVYSKKYQTGPIQFYLVFSLTAILMFEFVVSAIRYGNATANAGLIGAAVSGSFFIVFLGSKLSSVNLIKGFWGNINYSVNPFTDDVVTQNFVGEKIYLSSFYADRGLADYTSETFTEGVIKSRTVLINGKPTRLFSRQDSEWFYVTLQQPLRAEGFRSRQVLIKFKESHSSLNAKKFFLVQLLLIPEELSHPKMHRDNFRSIGWTFLRTSPEYYE